ncbi:hypothetical protein WJX77_009918 [Trebouxia sp. C0004]
MTAQEAEPRLMISQMVLENFKSYAGAQHVGPFHKSFTSVVGPNGSGKSNVIDAMLFVFGKRAKQLRLNKVSELIHNSTNHKNLLMARVCVHFQEILDTGDETFEVNPESHFTVSRTAHRNNSSDYYIDEKKSNFTEVTKLLKSKGIDLDNNRFLILQGEVEQISMMKPKSQTPHDTGLLEYLEDIIGTDKYVERIEECAKMLESLNEARQGQVNRVKIAEKEREGLEGEKIAAEAYLFKDAERLGAQSKIFQRFMHDGQRNLTKIEGNVGDLDAKLKHEQEKFKTYNKDLKEAEKKFKDMSADHGSVAKELERANEEFKEFERKDIKYREDLKHLKAKLKRLQDRLAKDSARMQAGSTEAEQLATGIPELTTKAQQLEQQLQAQEQVLQQLQEGVRGEVEQHTQALQEVRRQLAPWDQQISQVQSRLAVATAEQDMLQKSHSEAQQRYQDAEQGAKTASSSASSKDKEVLQMEAQLQHNRQAVGAVQQEEANAASQVEKLNQALQDVRGKVQQRRADSQAQTSQGAVVKALMAAKSSKEIPGILGRLGDLGAIDAKYDIAVSTSCGALDYMVVDNTGTAQCCVEMLRRRGLGVATFLILDKQQHLAKALQERPSPPEGVPRLFDLVRVREERVRLAFYFALRDTVVADSLDQASRIAYGKDKRWGRVVTIKGEMINESGTMSGGGGKPRGGRMCLGKAALASVDNQAVAADLQAAEQELEHGAQALQEAKARRDAASAEVRCIHKEVTRLEVAIPKLQLEAAAARQQAADLEHRLAQLSSAAQMKPEDSARLTALKKEMTSAEAELAKLKKNAAGLVGQAEKLQGQIDNAGGVEMKQQKQEVSVLQQEIADTEGEITKRKVQITAVGKQAEKLSKDCAKTQKELGQANADLEGKQQEQQEMDAAALKVLKAAEDTKQLLQQKEEVLAEIRGEFEQKSREVGIIRQVEVELDNTLRDLRDSHKEEASKLKKWRALDKDVQAKLAEFPIQGDDLLVGTLEEEELLQLNVQQLEYRVAMLEEELGRMNPDMTAIAAFQAKEAEYAQRVSDLEAATAERDNVRREHEDVRKRRLDEFMAGFNCISLRLKEMYQMITLGGDAELELVDSLDPFSEGIVFSVRPPKKSWKNIANLSGGEKTLSSLSLVFALHHYKPTPLYVMDEIDAALDFKNVSIVAHYIKERTKNAQFVIISLRNNMFELADRLVGIYKTNNATKSVAINPGEFVVGCKQPKEGQSNQSAQPTLVAA